MSLNSPASFPSLPAEHLLALRRTALQTMQMLLEGDMPIRCYLSGSVASGDVNEYSDINIQVFADSAKELEIFLLNRGLRCRHKTPRSQLAEAVIVLETDIADINLVIYPPNLERVNMPPREGQERQRLKPTALARMVGESELALSTSNDPAAK